MYIYRVPIKIKRRRRINKILMHIDTSLKSISQYHSNDSLRKLLYSPGLSFSFLKITAVVIFY